MYDNIIFDLYGTLIDIHTDEEDIAVWKHMCEFYAEHGVKYNPAGLRSKYKRQVRRAQIPGDTNTGCVRTAHAKERSGCR